MRYSAVALIFAAATIVRPEAQTPSGSSTSVRFELASVKPTKYVNGPMTLDVPARGALTATNYPVLGLINYAYGLKNRYQLSGNPEWLWSERFMIRALPPDDAPRDQIPQMMQTLLAERFKLRAHWETREQPIYALVVARGDGRLGPDLQRSQHDCAAFLATGANPLDASAPRDSRGRVLCSRFGRIGAAVGTTIGGAPLSELVTWLENFGAAWGGLDRPIVDRTNLTGNFDASIEFAFRPGSLTVNPSANRVDVPDIYQAVQEQLGLKLDPQNAPARILVIDSVERPSED
jgi:uncharacterized protein (TIGR03435 family)